MDKNTDMTIAHQSMTGLNSTRTQTDSMIGSDLLANLHKIPGVAGKNFSAFLVLTDDTVSNLYGKLVSDSLTKLNKKVVFSTIKPGENQKDIRTIPAITKPFFNMGFDRNSCLINLGGGVITDIGGFLASILLRGIDHINIPTTLIGQVDAAIGGKNGVNFGLHHHMYKNMLGSFKQPSLVITDIDTLSSLPDKEIINGLGEIVKYWIGWGKPKKSQISNLKSQIEKANLLKIISECQQIKLDIVRRDTFETKGLRQKLNLGHTIGHAIEAVSNGKLNHGQAISLGLVATAKISLKMNFLHPDRYEMIIDTMTKMGLPTSIKNLETCEVLLAIKYDKKNGNFILIKDIGLLLTNIKVDKDLIKNVLSEVIL